MALRHAIRPAVAATVFAGGDEQAVAHVRGLLSEFPPSSPSVALFRNGKPVYMMHRRDIESRDAFQIARILTTAFEQHCAKEPVNA